jgi:hypothetical protein
MDMTESAFSAPDCVVEYSESLMGVKDGKSSVEVFDVKDGKSLIEEFNSNSEESS